MSRDGFGWEGGGPWIDPSTLPTPCALFRVTDSPFGPGWAVLSDPEVWTATALDEVVPLLTQVAESGRVAFGSVAYEAAAAFDPALVTHPARGPLARFWVSRGPVWFFSALVSFGEMVQLESLPTWTASEYSQRFGAVQEALGSGRTYQANLTFPVVVQVDAPAATFARLCGVHPPRFAAFLRDQDDWIASLSPELFFDQRADELHAQPMKGTAPQSLGPDFLPNSPKDRAENLMIVDMIRNDLHHLTREVEVRRLFEVEPYGDLFQMTSTIVARGRHNLVEVFRALFPCASIVGAPKVETSRLLTELESGPRGVYCGALGVVWPDGKSTFSVAIRTLTPDGFGVGSGVVWDSTASGELQECLSKIQVLHDAKEPFGLVTTGRVEPDGTLLHHAEHQARLERSWKALGFPGDAPALIVPEGISSVIGRWLADPTGTVTFSSRPIPAESEVRCIISTRRLRTGHPLQGHKTNVRPDYDAALAEARTHGADDAILLNEHGEVTDTPFGNILFRRNGEWFTPPLSSGALPGVGRALAIAQDGVKEARLHQSELHSVEALVRVSATRGKTPVKLIRT
jgi:para-aminobenzoate synthetase/4-amino-4-deoxychorismate lyase